MVHRPGLLNSEHFMTSVQADYKIVSCPDKLMIRTSMFLINGWVTVLTISGLPVLNCGRYGTSCARTFVNYLLSFSETLENFRKCNP